jgi:ribosomal protein L18E
VDPDEVVVMTGRVLTDEKLKKKQTTSGTTEALYKRIP